MIASGASYAAQGAGIVSCGDRAGAATRSKGVVGSVATVYFDVMLCAGVSGAGFDEVVFDGAPTYTVRGASDMTKVVSQRPVLFPQSEPSTN